MTIPHRGWTSNSTYFVSASCWEKQRLLQSARMAELFIDVLYHYREQQKYLLHEFVVMPNHFHLLITPGETLERALQLVKGGKLWCAKCFSATLFTYFTIKYRSQEAAKVTFKVYSPTSRTLGYWRVYWT
jgi:REP element-mobilizing transposase RayT